ncbi:MAG: hypothetical protein N2114_07075, partial [Candidatus Goldbacteria bacterium]|nr:hypothetical protein [Candidatus Goldiibacteriota bacterium]
MLNKKLYIFGNFILTIWLFISLIIVFMQNEYSIDKEIIFYKTIEKYNSKIQKGWNIWIKEGEN